MVDRSVLIRLGLNPSDFNRGLASASAASRAFVRDLDTTNTRMSTLVQSSLALGPALVPVAAAASGAVLGLANSLGAAAAATGIAVFAFQGVGDALGALGDFQVDPTQEKFDKLRETFDELGPAGREFVLFLNSLSPELEKLQAVAQEGIFPGLEEGIGSLATLLPRVTDVVESLASASGELAADAGRSLDSPFWRDFLDFAATDGRDALVTMGQIIGQLTKAAAGLVMAFDPLSDDIGEGLLDVATRMADASASLDESQGFQDFVAYVEDVGPDVWQALEAVADALVSVAAAAAPVGAITLPVLEALAETVSAIASSPVGSVLVGAAAGVAALSRAVSLYKATSGSALLALFEVLRNPPPAGSASWSGTVDALARVPWTRVAGGVSLLALSFTDLDESMGLSSTASFAAGGAAIAGGWGALIGGLVGAVNDAVHANDDLEDSIRRVQDALDGGTWAEQSASIDDLRGRVEALTAELSVNDAPLERLGELFEPGSVWDQVKSLWGGDQFTQANDALADALDQRQRMLDEFSAGAPKTDFSGLFDPNLIAKSLSAVEDGISFADSAPGRLDNVAAAFVALSSEIDSTATSADMLQQALDELLSPQMDLEAAADAYTTGLRHLVDELAKHNKTLKGNSDAAIQNRAAIRDRVDDLKAQIVAEAKAGATTEEGLAKFRELRQRLLDSAEAAGLNRDEVAALIREYGLVPHKVKTIIEANTDPARAAVNAYKEYVESLKPTLTIRQRIVETRLGIQDGSSGADRTFGRQDEADGGILRFYAAGGMEDHVAQIARRGVTRVWAEPETGGEAYIPLAHTKRARSEAILSQVAREFGGTFVKYANGGIRSSQSPVVNVTGGSMSLTGMRVQIDTGKGTFWGTVRDVARTEVDAAQSYEATKRRQR